MVDDNEPRDSVSQAVGWALDHVIVDANFEGASVLLVGDPRVLADGPKTASGLNVQGCEWLDLPQGRALAIEGPGADTDGPFAWVLASDDGPLSSVEISPFLETGGEGLALGSMELPTGRLVLGMPESIAAWGPDVTTRDREPGGEWRVNDRVPGPLREGYLVVVQLDQPGQCDVLVSQAASSRLQSVSVHLPRPGWVPPGRPIIEKDDS